MVVRMKSFLRDEVGCQALVSNANSWTYFVTDQSAREVYDYVDDHFYVDHPRFLERPWRLPSSCANSSPIAAGAVGGRSKTFTRVFGKPFTISEFNYSGPGRFRGVGGILTGAMGALQGWGGIWRFAYSHNRASIIEPSQGGYFDLASDPLSQAAERASLCLFLRGDLQMAPDTLALLMSVEDLNQPAASIPRLAPDWHWTAWVTRVGTALVRDSESQVQHTIALPLGWATPAETYRDSSVVALDPYASSDSKLMGLLRDRRIITPSNPTAPEKRVFVNGTGEITVDGKRDMLILDTLCTAGGYAPAGKTIDAPQGGVKVTILGSGATLWVSALDREPIVSSRRLLVTHLTDLQNSEVKYAELARQTLLDWGHMPQLVRNGQAETSIKLENPNQYLVWALGQGGRRMATVPNHVRDGVFVFKADVAGDREGGARMLYEISVE